MSMAKKRSAVRIVAFGDSVTRGLAGEGVTEAKTYRKVLRRRLRDALGRNGAVINAGADGGTSRTGSRSCSA